MTGVVLLILAASVSTEYEYQIDTLVFQPMRRPSSSLRARRAPARPEAAPWRPHALLRERSASWPASVRAFAGR